MDPMSYSELYTVPHQPFRLDVQEITRPDLNIIKLTGYHN